VNLDGRRPEAEREPKRVGKAKETLDASYRVMNDILWKRSPGLMGEPFTMADCALAPALFYLRNVYPFAQQANIEAYWKRVSEPPV
jgi:glutathione S-transferase